MCSGGERGFRPFNFENMILSYGLGVMAWTVLLLYISSKGVLFYLVAVFLLYKEIIQGGGVTLKKHEFTITDGSNGSTFWLDFGELVRETNFVHFQRFLAN